MFHRLCATALAAAVLLAASACTDPREARRAAERTTLSSQLQEADSARTLASQAVAAQARKVQALEEELADVRSRAAAFQRAVQAFMMEHKMAVAALAAGAAGGAAALDDSGRFTPEARQIGAAVGVFALGWALFNLEEVAHVADELVKANTTMQGLTEREASLAQTLPTERDALQQAQAGLDRVTQQATGIRMALQAL